jgi:uncharacterized iron-regulated protein
MTLKNVLEETLRHKVTIFGEVTSNKEVIDFVFKVSTHSMNDDLKKLHIVLEHFSFEMQYLLDDFQDNKIPFSVLLSTYIENGAEKHDILEYKDMLLLA